MSDKVSPLSLAVDNKTDAQFATEIRIELTTALQPVVDSLNRARTHGLEVSFSLQRDQTGRWFIPPLNISKPL